MHTLRFYFCDSRGRIVRGDNHDCEEREIEAVARQLLTSAGGGVDAIEVWETGRFLHRITRRDVSD